MQYASIEPCKQYFQLLWTDQATQIKHKKEHAAQLHVLEKQLS